MTSSIDTLRPALPTDRATRARQATGVLALLLLLACGLSLQIGATDVTLSQVVDKLVRGEALTRLERVVMLNIRLPRLALAIIVGAGLAVSGAVMQGLFRNPLADPGIVGVSSGAGLGAVLAIVLGGYLPLSLANALGPHLIPVAAFLGGWLVTILLYKVSTRNGRTSVATMLLAGIAIGALTAAFMGVLIFAANDQQLRDLNFWLLGSLAGANWAKISIAGPLILLSIAAACALGRGLNGLALGEATAAHIGFAVQRLKNHAILMVAIASGASVALSGGIGFVGIVVPHLLRLATGPDHRALLVNSALLGAALLILADIVARTIVAPAELPIGIVTAILGAPVFLWILLSQRNVVDL